MKTRFLGLWDSRLLFPIPPNIKYYILYTEIFFLYIKTFFLSHNKFVHIVLDFFVSFRRILISISSILPYSLYFLSLLLQKNICNYFVLVLVVFLLLFPWHSFDLVHIILAFFFCFVHNKCFLFIFITRERKKKIFKTLQISTFLLKS